MRTPSLTRNTKVVCVQTTDYPERISKRTGELKPAETKTKVLVGTVIRDYGKYIYVQVQYPSGYTISKSFLPHEVSLESKFNEGIGPSTV